MCFQALASVNMADEIRKGEVKSEKSSYVVNPPLIHSLCITADGLIAAVGLENGKVSSLQPPVCSCHLLTSVGLYLILFLFHLDPFT